MARRIGYSVRRLASGRWQALVRAEDGKQVGIGSWSTQQAADRAGQQAAVDMRKHLWIDPRLSDITVAAHLKGWLDRKAKAGEHGDKYAEEAARMARLYINPTLGRVVLTDLRPSHVQRWHSEFRAARLAERGTVGLVPAKTYRLLHAALEDAVRGQLLTSNPCIVPGAAVEKSPERPLLTPEQVAELAVHIDPRWSALVLTAAWGGLRFGEAGRLRRGDVDLLHGTIRIHVAKSRAGVRTVHLPRQLVAVLERHLDTYVMPDPGALVFTGERGGALSKNFTRREFRDTADRLGHTGLHFHDLRHYAGTMTAVSGATQREIMARLGHASPAAAIRYQHASKDRLALVAEALGAAWVEPSAARPKVRKMRG